MFVGTPNSTLVIQSLCLGKVFSYFLLSLIQEAREYGCLGSGKSYEGPVEGMLLLTRHLTWFRRFR